MKKAADKAAGADIIRSEKTSGTTMEGREELKTILAFLREGDTLLFTRIDRLARSISDMQDIAKAVKAKGAALKCTEQPIDTSSASGKCFFDVLSAFAEFETSLRKERQAEGIAKAKKAGVYKGRPVSIKEDKIAEMKRLKAEGWGATKIAEKVGVSRISVYRALAES